MRVKSMYVTILTLGLIGATTSLHAQEKSELHECTQRVLHQQLSIDTDQHDAISNALAACHHSQAIYSQQWIAQLQSMGYSATEHLQTLVWVHSYDTALKLLNHSFPKSSRTRDENPNARRTAQQ
ncbi:hypothetical protein [Simiduia aestuariiviva]|uniref:DUF3718 domain-containing protein n=1 Tax=Simiduia aestuariiviva TaxID=1510459 RepID=A0A839UM04_9GAMM|nr:hypothetical protein [Simiduia aestuariiviva]MBB3167801.1 hypothetical protein [Simiduia aestuariiviva]